MVSELLIPMPKRQTIVMPPKRRDFGMGRGSSAFSSFLLEQIAASTRSGKGPSRTKAASTSTSPPSERTNLFKSLGAESTSSVSPKEQKEKEREREKEVSSIFSQFMDERRKYILSDGDDQFRFGEYRDVAESDDEDEDEESEAEEDIEEKDLDVLKKLKKLKKEAESAAEDDKVDGDEEEDEELAEWKKIEREEAEAIGKLNIFCDEEEEDEEDEEDDEDDEEIEDIEIDELEYGDEVDEEEDEDEEEDNSDYEEEEEEEDVGVPAADREALVDPKGVELIVHHVQCTRREAEQALARCDNDIFTAILYLTM